MAEIGDLALKISVKYDEAQKAFSIVSAGADGVGKTFKKTGIAISDTEREFKKFFREQKLGDRIMRESSQVITGLAFALSAMANSVGDGNTDVRKFTEAVLTSVVVFQSAEFAIQGLNIALKSMGVAFSFSTGLISPFLAIAGGLIAFFINSGKEAEEAERKFNSYNESFKKINEEYKRQGFGEQLKGVEEYNRRLKELGEAIDYISPKFSVTKRTQTDILTGREIVTYEKELVKEGAKQLFYKGEMVEVTNDLIVALNKEFQFLSEAKKELVDSREEVMKLIATKKEQIKQYKTENEVKEAISKIENNIGSLTEEERIKANRVLGVLREQLDVWENIGKVKDDGSEKFKKEIDKGKEYIAVQNEIIAQEEANAEAEGKATEAALNLLSEKEQAPLKFIASLEDQNKTELDLLDEKFNEYKSKYGLDEEAYAAYQKKKSEIVKKEEEARTEMQEQGIAQTLSALSQAFPNVKEFAIADALMNTYLSATKAYQSMVGIPVVGPALAVIASGAAIVQGMKAVEQIKKAEYWQGGYTGDGDRFEAAGVVHRGEFVFEKPIVDRYGGELAALRMSMQRGYAGGGFVGGNINAFPKSMTISGVVDLSNGKMFLRTEMPRYNKWAKKKFV